MSLAKRCSRCGGKKGAKYRRYDVCGKCVAARRRDASERAHRARIAKRYGLPEDWYDRMYELQGGRCFICQKATGKTKHLAVDHNHETDEKRGLLCATCNRIIGFAGDEIAFFERAIEYLRNPPAKGLAA